MLTFLQMSHLFDFHIPLTLNPSCMPHHNFSWPIQTLTASHSRACLMERSSWTASSRRSSHETHACRCGGQVQSRPGWRLSWECPCTSEPALKTSKVARYTFGIQVAVCLLCAWEWGMMLFLFKLDFCSLGATRPHRWGFGAGSGY